MGKNQSQEADMFLGKKNVVLGALITVIFAVFSPFLYDGYINYVYPYADYLRQIINRIFYLNIRGYYMPWRVILISAVAGGCLLYFKRRRKMINDSKKEDHSKGPILISGKTLLEIHNASRNIEALNKRIDIVEKTMYMIMKQMEEVTKCLTQGYKEEKGNANNNVTASLETHI